LSSKHATKQRTSSAAQTTLGAKRCGTRSHLSQAHGNSRNRCKHLGNPQWLAMSLVLYKTLQWLTSAGASIPSLTIFNFEHSHPTIPPSPHQPCLPFLACATFNVDKKSRLPTSRHRSGSAGAYPAIIQPSTIPRRLIGHTPLLLITEQICCLFHLRVWLY
jgi:hypothetical protein